MEIIIADARSWDFNEQFPFCLCLLIVKTGHLKLFIVTTVSNALNFKVNFSKKKFLRTLSECQTVCIQIRTDILSVLIWVQTVCKGYQQKTTKSTSSKERVNKINFFFE